MSGQQWVNPKCHKCGARATSVTFKGRRLVCDQHRYEEEPS